MNPQDSSKTPETISGSHYLGLFQEHRKSISFATILNFLSSYGQTFFISLVLPGMALASGVSLERAGGFYSVATILSATFLALMGHYADRLSPKSYSLICTGVLITACFVASFASNPISLFVALVLVRWAGQGLMPHASSVAVAKRFPSRPGAAYAITSLGFPIGEAAFPIILTTLLLQYSANQVWMGLGTMTLLCVLPVLVWSGRSYDDLRPTKKESSITNPFASSKVWSDQRLWWLAPHIFSVPFCLTGFLFYQTYLLSETGWTIWHWATGLSAFAISRALFSLGTGSWLSQRKALPYIAVIKAPMALGALILAIPGIPAEGLLLFFFLSGASMGASTVVDKTALVELYGPEVIGRAKAAINAVAVLSTAAAPPIYGWIADRLDSQWTLIVLAGNAAVMIFCTLFTMAAIKPLKRLTPKNLQEQVQPKKD
ncbi:MAG: MFS transporter [Verrucomicrobiota bacterium]